MSELEDFSCEHCGAMAGACADYPHCANGPTEADRLRGALNRLGLQHEMLEAENAALVARIKSLESKV